MLRHPADGSQWRKVDRTFPTFANEARNIRFGLSTDGMNPFGEQSSGHSTWPVTLCIYNLPPWLCMKRKLIMMPVLIPGPKQPGNDIEVYLKPLIENLLLLWKEEGVRMWDAHAEDHFNLRALLFVTTNDWPALSNLFGQSNKGYRACTHCLEETDSTYLKHCRKIVYMGHRRFLPIKHPLRRRLRWKGRSSYQAWAPLWENGVWNGQRYKSSIRKRTRQQISAEWWRTCTYVEEEEEYFLGVTLLGSIRCSPRNWCDAPNQKSLCEPSRLPWCLR